MYLPGLKSVSKTTDSVVRWLGYNHNDAPAEGSFYDCQNISTGLYPVLTARGRRASQDTSGSMKATCVRDGVLYWTQGAELYKENTKIANLLLAGSVQRQIIAMGAWVIVFPDGVRYNAEDGTVDTLGAKNTAASVQVTLCKYDKTAYTDYVVSGTAPGDTAKLWLDTGETPHVLKMYSTSAKDWVSVGTTYVRITAAGLGRGLALYDTVKVSGLTGYDDLNGDMIVYAADDDGIMVAGIIDAAATVTGTITVERELPELDYITECNNRLWGCSTKTNELRACKLGDPTNWTSYMGLNTDSYAVTVGAPGRFTGAVTFLGYVLFFKEDCLLKLFGTKPSNYQISQTNCRGVQQGSEKSLVIVNETLYYKSPVDVVSYDGGLPSSISEALGNVAYKNAVARVHQREILHSHADRSGGEPRILLRRGARIVEPGGRCAGHGVLLQERGRLHGDGGRQRAEDGAGRRDGGQGGPERKMVGRDRDDRHRGAEREVPEPLSAAGLAAGGQHDDRQGAVR